MRVPFTKAHGANNDFLLTWASQSPRQDLPAVARALCARHTGIGADGWLLVTAAPVPGPGYEASIRLFNADGSEAEISGNGTRCAAAFLIDSGTTDASEVRICTAAGVKHLRVIERLGLRYLIEMNMGRPSWEPGQLNFSVPLERGLLETAIVHVGNPQCVVFVQEFPADWKQIGAELESHRLFVNRTNVSFVRAVDAHTLEVRFFERGVGETMSSGTGSTGAVVAATLRGAVRSPVRVVTPAGPLDLRWEDEVFLTGPAEIIAGGEFYL